MEQEITTFEERLKQLECNLARKSMHDISTHSMWTGFMFGLLTAAWVYLIWTAYNSTKE